MNVIIVGCGRMGAELAGMLNLRGHAVTVIDSDPSAFERLGHSFRGRTIVGIGFDRDVLLQAGIEHTDGLAALTTSDEANAVVARIASQLFGVPTVVARLYDPRKARIFRRLGIRTVAPVAWAANHMADILSYTRLEAVAALGEGAQIVEVHASHELADRAVQDVTALGEVQVIAITRGEDTFIPTLGTILHEGDTVHFAVLTGSTERLQALVGLA